MKLIRSNKKGFGIHSPFVYRLITRVLFPNANFYIFEKIDKLLISINEKVELKQLFRLLNFFEPDVVLFLGKTKTEELEIVSNLNVEIYTSESITDFEKKENRALESVPFVVFSEITSQPENIFPENNSVWFIKKTNNNAELNRFFQTLLNNEMANITIELKNALVVIFDKKFHKQNYVIK